MANKYMQPIDEHRDGIPRIYKAPADEMAQEYPTVEATFQPFPLYGYCEFDILRETSCGVEFPTPLKGLTKEPV